MSEKKAQAAQNEAAVVSVDAELEEAKAHGKTPEQQELREYNEGRFQTHDPITGEARSLNQPAARLDLSEEK